MQDEAIEPANTPTELEPYLLYHESESRCATWRIADNEADALAFFYSESALAAYREFAGLGEGWSVLRPDRRQLAVIVQAAIEGGVLYAVLDPTGDSARRIFQLRPMWEQIQSLLKGG